MKWLNKPLNISSETLHINILSSISYSLCSTQGSLITSFYNDTSFVMILQSWNAWLGWIRGKVECKIPQNGSIANVKHYHCNTFGIWEEKRCFKLQLQERWLINLSFKTYIERFTSLENYLLLIHLQTFEVFECLAAFIINKISRVHMEIKDYPKKKKQKKQEIVYISQCDWKD